MINGVVAPNHSGKQNPSKTNSVERLQQKDAKSREGRQKTYRVPTDKGLGPTLKSSSSSSSD